MANTPCIMKNDGMFIEYTPVAAVIAGQVIVLGNLVAIAPHAIEAGQKGILTLCGAWNVPKTSDVFSQGSAVYWDADGDPVGGTAGTGAADTSQATGNLMGYCAEDAATGAAYVRVNLTAAALTLGNYMPYFPVATVAAAGSAQGDAAALSDGFNLVTGADDAKGVILPAAVAGRVVVIKVGPGADLKVYPATGDTINKGSANAAITVVDDVCFMLIAADATDWYTLPLLPS